MNTENQTSKNCAAFQSGDCPEVKCEQGKCPYEPFYLTLRGISPKKVESLFDGVVLADPRFFEESM